MTIDPSFEEDPGGEREKVSVAGQLVVDLQGYEGPIDVLLQLAREQKVDITRLSILDLAEQYLAFVREARRLRLELAADYLVMAAWLAYLKSRLLLPEPEAESDEPSGPEMAAALRFQLQRLQAMREVGEGLFRRARLGVDVFPRGEPEALPIVTKLRYECALYDLLRAYGRQHTGSEAASLRIDPMDLYSIEEALKRLRKLLVATPEWHTLMSFLPEDAGSGLPRRSAYAAMFAAGLELCRDGRAEIRQDRMFGPVFLRARAPHAQAGDDEGA